MTKANAGMPEQLKGGAQSRRAAMLCQEPRFCLYLDQRRRVKHGLTLAQLPDGTHTLEDAVDAVRQACDVSSRAEIDHCDHARAMLDKIITSYSKWERGQRRTG